MIVIESDNVGGLIQSKFLKIFKPKFVMICKTINDKNTPLYGVISSQARFH